VFICDVMGHGVRAALVTAMVRALVEEFQSVAHDPSQFLSGINHDLLSILKRMDDSLFATAGYLIADVARGELHYATAGHPLPFHLRRQDDAVVVLPPPAAGLGPALGLFEGATYPTAHHALAAHDLVLLFTDGLFEVLDDQDCEFGEDRLLAAVRQHRALPPPQLLDQLIHQCRQYSATGEFADDVCLIAVEAAKLIT
jgi:serine phosphatase RsbU (regulator of sigma subunit)